MKSYFSRSPPLIVVWVVLCFAAAARRALSNHDGGGEANGILQTSEVDNEGSLTPVNKQLSAPCSASRRSSFTQQVVGKSSVRENRRRKKSQSKCPSLHFHSKLFFVNSWLILFCFNEEVATKTKQSRLGLACNTASCLLKLIVTCLFSTDFWLAALNKWFFHQLANLFAC